MRGVSGILLMVALVLISGLIAYVGDIVGRRMGRKRLSLFGLRPRHTAIVISVVAGMLITVMTLVVAMAVSRDVKDGFLRVVEMRRQQAEMADRLTELSAGMADLEAARAKTEAELQQRQRELDEAKGALEAVSSDLTSTRKDLDNASGALERAEGAVQRVGGTWLELARKKDELQRDVETLRAQIAGGITLERFSPVVFGAGQPLDWQLIDGNRPIRAIRRDLDELVRRVDEAAQRAGARPLPDADRVVVIRKPVRDTETNVVAWFDEDHVLDAVAERVRENASGVIVRAFSVFNTHPGEPVRIDFELFRNNLVFRRGEVLAQTVVDGRQPEPALMAALLSLLREQVNPKARSHNVMPRPTPPGSAVLGVAQESVGDISIDELFAVMRRLQAIDGPARLSAVAAADTWTIGPLEVDLLVAPAR